MRTTGRISPEAGRYLLAQRTNLQSSLAGLYLASCEGDAKFIADTVPGGSTCVDLGGGLGGVSACLSRYWPTTTFLILERNGYEGRKVDYGPDFGKYNGLQETGAFLKSLGVKHQVFDVEHDSWPAKTDLVFSVLSWGFHYPIEEYLGWVTRVTTTLLVDCRVGTKAEQSLQKGFKSVTKVRELPKREWFLCKN